MCNAWNHPIGCRCGWGGEGHAGQAPGGRNSVRSFADVAAFRYRKMLDAYTTPNASCPVCGAAVYFYQSEAGGRVFFDELGPPWYKHPCTDSVLKPISFAVPSIAKGGWHPILIESFARIPIYTHCYAVSGQTTNGHIAFFIRSTRLNLRAPIFIRRTTDGTINLSSIQPYMSGFTTIELPVWRSVLEASRAPVDAWSREQETDLKLFELMNARSSRGEA